MEFNFDLENLDREGPDDDSNDISPVRIVVKKRMKQYYQDFILKEEDETLGEILKTYLEKDERLEFVSTRKDHILNNEIRITLGVKKEAVGDSTINFIMMRSLQDAIQSAINETISLRNDIAKNTNKPYRYLDNANDNKMELNVNFAINENNEKDKGGVNSLVF